MEIEQKFCYSLLHNAVRNNIIKRKPCVICKLEKAEAHHPDYAKPLEIVWLCHKHHCLVHSGKIKFQDKDKEIINIDLKEFQEKWEKRRHRIPKNLMRYRKEIVVGIWEKYQAELTMQEIEKICQSVYLDKIYAILKEAREAKEKEFHDHLTYKANPDFKK